MNKKEIELERLKVEYDHCEKLVWNVLWLMSLFVAFVVVGILVGVVNYFAGIFISAIIGLVVAILMIPVAKRSDDIIKKKIPELK